VSLIVLDASVVAAWSLPSQHTSSAEALLLGASEHRFLVPHIFPLEVRNLFLAAERRDKWKIADTETALSGLDELDLSVARMDDPVELRSVIGVARMEGLTLYDSFYLRLAETDTATLASRDRPLLAAASRRGVGAMDLNA
jgi:predicted nucleic acid-binding protein